MSKDKTEEKSNPFDLPVDWLRDDLIQGDLEEFALAYQVYEDAKRTTGLLLYHGALLRSAIEAGWLNLDIAVADVSKMHGGKVKWMAQAIDREYNRAVDIPKN